MGKGINERIPPSLSQKYLTVHRCDIFEGGENEVW